MQKLKRLFDFYINSSVHVALAVCSLVWISFIDFDLPLDENLMFFVFFASITGYNFVKYFGLAKFHHRSLANWLKLIQIFSLFSFVGLCYFGFKLEIKTLMYIAGFGLITFLYAVPFLPKKIVLEGGKNLRAISGVKIYIIAFVWAGITVLLPVVNENQALDFDVILSFLQRFIYVLVATLPFEIRDMQFDSLKLATIPQRIGIKLTKILGSVLLISFIAIEYIKYNTSMGQLSVLIAVSVLLGLFLLLSQVRQPKYYSSFLVEGIPVLWLGLLLLFT